jgi:hypothetical protein
VADVLHCSSLEERNANAAYIVRACNAHEELVKALEGLLAGPNWPGAQMTARNALALASGKEQPCI